MRIKSMLPFMLALTISISGGALETGASEINGKTIKETIKNLKHANPKKDAKEALQHGDKRFIGLMGYALMVPFVDDEERKPGAPDYRKIFGVKIIEGTSDYIANDDIEMLNDLGRRYALEYNKTLFKGLKSGSNGTRKSPTNGGSR